MEKIKVLFTHAKIASLPEKKDGENGVFYTFLVSDGTYKYKVVVFDDEREKNPFKKLDDALDKGNLSRGTFINMECELSRYQAYAITDEKWKTISNDPNPTKVYFDTFKLKDWDYAVPYEIHQEFKQMAINNQIPKPSVIKPLGLEGGTVL